MRPRGASGERGIALITVLWVLALLSVIALGLTVQTRSELQLARNLVDGARARALAEAGVFLAVPRLLDQNPATQWHADGEVHEFAYGGGRIRVTLQDEGGKIDINAAPDELLSGGKIERDIIRYSHHAALEIPFQQPDI